MEIIINKKNNSIALKSVDSGKVFFTNDMYFIKIGYPHNTGRCFGANLETGSVFDWSSDREVEKVDARVTIL